MKEAGKTVYVGGNIGKPLLPDVADMDPEDYAVLELSSFQLMTMEQSPNIAVITNLAPNHLDYHHTMEEYTNAKKNIFLHQGEGDRLILNYDNEVTRSMAAEAVCPVTWFSRKERLEEGVYLRDNAIWLTNEMGSREVLPLSDIQLPGVHNIETTWPPSLRWTVWSPTSACGPWPAASTAWSTASSWCGSWTA